MAFLVLGLKELQFLLQVHFSFLFLSFYIFIFLFNALFHKTFNLVAVVVLVNSANDWQKEKQFRKLNAKKEDRDIQVLLK